MVILIDTREKQPLEFDCPTKTMTLDPGDYSVDGIQSVFRAERKKPKEIWSCVGTGRERFRSQLDRLSSYPYRMLIIEGTVSQLRSPPPRTRMSANQVTARLMRWSVAYGIPIWFLANRSKSTLGALENLFSGIYDAYRRDTTFPNRWKVMTDGS